MLGLIFSLAQGVIFPEKHPRTSECSSQKTIDVDWGYVCVCENRAEKGPATESSWVQRVERSSTCPLFSRTERSSVQCELLILGPQRGNQLSPMLGKVT
jgi:hypothetical protein